jgi:hypothetical protein
MIGTATPFHESHDVSTPIRDLGLAIEGTSLEPAVAALLAESEARGIAVRPRFYLSTEWGVPCGTVAIAIPFYLASAELTALHERRTGHVEGTDRADVMRYLRHEMGHVVNYAYRLHDRPEWVERFGDMAVPYTEEYRPQPFSRSFVRHLPGWYAQKHPDEDWAETFAVWLTPGLDWRREYAGWPGALAKLEYCEATMAELRDRPPDVTDDELDEDVATLGYSVGDFYGEDGADSEPPPGLDGALRSIFDDTPAEGERARGGDLLRELARTLPAEVFRWTGHLPEHTRALLAQMARRADELGCAYDTARAERHERAVIVLVAALAMTHVLSGSYAP